MRTWCSWKLGSGLQSVGFLRFFRGDWPSVLSWYMWSTFYFSPWPFPTSFFHELSGKFPPPPPPPSYYCFLHRLLLLFTFFRNWSKSILEAPLAALEIVQPSCWKILTFVALGWCLSHFSGVNEKKWSFTLSLFLSLCHDDWLLFGLLVILDGSQLRSLPVVHQATFHLIVGNLFQGVVLILYGEIEGRNEEGKEVSWRIFAESFFFFVFFYSRFLFKFSGSESAEEVILHRRCENRAENPIAPSFSNTNLD